MKIGFDISPLQSDHNSRGVGFYTKNLLESLKKVNNLEVNELSSVSDTKSIDLLHIPYFDFFNKSLPTLKIPTIVTVHDATPLVFKDQYPAGIKGNINLFFKREP